MILLDFHAVMIANISSSYILNEDFELNEDMCRHMILNSIRSIKGKFGTQYGQLVISCDSQNYWRKDAFPFYKIKRKAKFDESTIDWGKIYDYMRKIKAEIKENFKFPLIEVDGAESDDIIAALTKYTNRIVVANFLDEEILFEREIEPVLIVSRDHDFYQLHKYKNVKQYDTIGDKFITIDDPKKTLFEHICKGDSGDSIPNVVSPENSIAISLRQKPMHTKKIDLWYENGVPEEVQQRFALNKKIIDFNEIPSKISDLIIAEYEGSINKKNKDNKNLMKYFMSHNLNQMLSSAQEFS